MPRTAAEPGRAVATPARPGRRHAAGLLCSLLCALAGGAVLASCTPKQKLGPEHFVGKWRSSKMMTPIYLYSNGEWEIKQDNGVVVEYGVWAYQDGSIQWTYKHGAQMLHESNRVVTYTPKAFQLIERLDVTDFTRIE